PSRAYLLLSNILLLTLGFSFAYAPEHWLSRVGYEGVTVDGRPVAASVYFGNPRHSEAEMIALVHVVGVGDYFVDFGGETYREGSKYEFMPLHYGAWTWRSMMHGRFRSPLPFQHVNECRIPLSNGRVLTVAF
ncbi:MAG: hypothetical protein ACXVZI_13195, partial [Terriglobales bacterium]